MVRCTHCGREHPATEKRCPITRELLAMKGPVGTKVDRYELEHLLGTGGFGSVYRARHAHTGQHVALKTLKKQFTQDAQMVERFLREARAAAAAGSEHIVRILDAGVAADGTAFLAMELLEGFDLKELLAREGPQPAGRLLRLLAQILDALDVAHKQGIIHRDLKPANVFVVRRKDASGQETDFAKLLDFGISKMGQGLETGGAGLTMAGASMGTPGYVAPEQLFDARTVDVRADLYSVGAMAYELLAGRLPVESNSFFDLILKVRTEVPPPLATLVPGLPAELGAAVDKALAREPGGRWASAAEFAAALRQSLPAVDAAPVRPVAARATPAPAGASMLYGATSTPARRRAPSQLSNSPGSGPSSSVVVDFGPAPAAPAQAAPAQAAPAQVAPAQAAPAQAAPPAIQVAPPAVQAAVAPVSAQVAPASAAPKRNAIFWLLVIAGGLTVLMGSCCALGMVSNALNGQ